jgi:hypothetical protein
MELDSTPRPTAGRIPAPTFAKMLPVLGNLLNDFDFNQTPRSAVLLPTNPPTDSPSIPDYFTGKRPCVGCTSVPP